MTAETVGTWLPLLVQGGFAVVSMALAFVVKAMWGRIVDLEKDKEKILVQSIADAKEDAKDAQELLKTVVEEQTKTRVVIERLERKLERSDP